MFTESHLNIFEQAHNISALIGQLDYNMDFLSYDLLDFLVCEFELKEVNVKMEVYKSDLQEFRKNTPLPLFCFKPKKIKLSPEFEEVVMRFDMMKSMTLEDIQQFRKEYTCHHRVHEFALMLASITLDSFTVTWFVPESIVKILGEVPKDLLSEHAITNLTIPVSCIKWVQNSQEVSNVLVVLDKYFCAMLI